MSAQDVINSINISLSHKYRRISDSTPSEILISEKEGNKHYIIKVIEVTDEKEKN